jgi:uncharacterized protein DUF4129
VTEPLFWVAAVSPQDSLRAVLREVFAAREYDWGPRNSPLIWLREQFLGLLTWFAGLEQSHPATYSLLLAAMVLVLLVIIAHVVYVLSRAFRAVTPEAAMRPAAGPGPRDAAWHLAEAGRLSAAGRYGQALSHRFLALVLELEGRKALTFHVSKTPAEYVTEARLDGEGRGRLRLLVLALYRHLFGGAPCTSAEWTTFDREAAELGARVAAS